MSDDDRAALQHYFANKIRAAEQVAAQKKADYDAARGEVTKLFAGVKSELLIKRKDFEEVLGAAAMSEAEFLAKEAARTKLFSLQGLPVGAQLDMFGAKNDAADDQAGAYADGKRAGLRADDPKPPSQIATMFHPDWMRGWSDGQDENLALIGKAEAVLEARKINGGEMVEGEDPDGEDDSDDDEPAGDDDGEVDIEAETKRVEATWAQPRAEETVFN